MKQTLWDIQKGKLKQYWNQNQKLNKIRTELKTETEPTPYANNVTTSAEKKPIKKE